LDEFRCYIQGVTVQGAKADNSAQRPGYLTNPLQILRGEQFTLKYSSTRESGNFKIFDVSDRIEGFRQDLYGIVESVIEINGSGHRHYAENAARK
jgi:hypothetical protein